MKYDMKSLHETFQKHAEITEKKNKEHKEKYPDRDQNIDWDFNLSKALESICSELIKINEKLDKKT